MGSGGSKGVTQKEVTDLLVRGKAGIKPGKTIAETTQKIEAVFKEWDANGDGQIDMAELEAVFAKLKLNLSPAEIQLLMSEADTDHNGMLNVQEFVDWLFEPPFLHSYFEARRKHDHADQLALEKLFKNHAAKRLKKHAADGVDEIGKPLLCSQGHDLLLSEQVPDQVCAVCCSAGTTYKCSKDCAFHTCVQCWTQGASYAADLQKHEEKHKLALHKQLTPLIKKSFDFHQTKEDPKAPLKGWLSQQEAIEFFAHYISELEKMVLDIIEISCKEQQKHLVTLEKKAAKPAKKGTTFSRGLTEADHEVDVNAFKAAAVELEKEMDKKGHYNELMAKKLDEWRLHRLDRTQAAFSFICDDKEHLFLEEVTEALLPGNPKNIAFEKLLYGDAPAIRHSTKIIEIPPPEGSAPAPASDAVVPFAAPPAAAAAAASAAAAAAAPPLPAAAAAPAAPVPVPTPPAV